MSKRQMQAILLLVLMLASLAVMIRRGKRNRELYPERETPAASAAEPSAEPVPVYAEQDFLITAVGDCTLASPQFIDPTEHRSIEYHIQQDYAYPFSNTLEYFEGDDLTLSNLECVLSDSGLFSYEQFSFLAPTAYAEILNEGGVDFVTTANNHLEDFGETGMDFTYTALEQHGVPYGKEGESQLITTESGLTVGIYCAYEHLSPDPEQAAAAIRQLREDGAEYVVCMFHWGKELVYSPNADQVELAHHCIDAGADLIYGSHSHCLQPIEEYGGGLILYSLGNWVFGGSTAPSDKDTAIIQIHVHRESDGTVRNNGYTVIPCCVSSRPVRDGYSGDNYNDYRPTPYTEGSDAYYRVFAKLEGTFQADSEGRDYSDVYAQYG